MQIPFDAAPLGFRGGDRLGARFGQAFYLGLPGRREQEAGCPAVAAQQPRGGQQAECCQHEACREQRRGRVLQQAGGRERDLRHYAACGEADQAVARERGGYGQQPAGTCVHRGPCHITPGRRVSQQPSQPRPPAELLVAGQRPVRLGDRHAAPRTGQTPGLVRQPPHGQQGGGQEEHADGYPGERSHPQDWRHPRGRVQHEPGTEPGENQRRGKREHQPGSGQRQCAQGQPAGGGDDALADPGPEPARAPAVLVLLIACHAAHASNDTHRRRR